MRFTRARGRLAAALALPLLVAVFYLDLLAGPRTVWFAGDDNAYQVLPWLEVQAREWRAGRVPLWDPFQWMGQPLLGQAQPAVASPPNWLLALKPEGAAGWWFLNCYFVLIRWIGAAGMYGLARSLGSGRAAAVAAGFGYAVLGWFAFSTRPQMAMGAMWAPWVLRYLLRALEPAANGPAGSSGAPGRRQGGRLRALRELAERTGLQGQGSRLCYAALGGFFLGLCWLGGHHQVPLYLSLACAMIWVAFAIPDWRRLAAAAVFFAMAGAAGASQILPAMEYGRRAVRWVGLESPIGWTEKIPVEIHRENSMPPLHLLSMAWPGYQGKVEVFAGSALLALALLAAWQVRRRTTAILSALAVWGAWVALGPSWGLHWLLYHLVPHMDKARMPAASLVLASVAIPALAAAGAGRLARDGKGERWRLAAAGLLVLLAAVPAVAAWHAGGADLRWRTAAGAAALAALLAASCRWRTPEWAWAAMCVAVCFAEARPLQGFVLARTGDRAAANVRLLESHGGVAEFLRRQDGFWRVEVDDADVPYNFGGWHGILQTQGYLASVTENIYRHELHARHGKRLFGVRYRVARTPSETHSRLVFEGKNGLRVYEWDAVLPRAFVVHQAEGLAGRRMAAAALHAIGEEIRHKTFLPGPVPRLGTCSGEESARIAEYSAGRVVVEARLACRGMVVLTDTWFPGWRAMVDGRPARIHEAYAAVRGVVAEAGEHRVEFRYLPEKALAGGALTALAALVAAACARRRRLH